MCRTSTSTSLASSSTSSPCSLTTRVGSLRRCCCNPAPPQPLPRPPSHIPLLSLGVRSSFPPPHSTRDSPSSLSLLFIHCTHYRVCITLPLLHFVSSCYRFCFCSPPAVNVCAPSIRPPPFASLCPEPCFDTSPLPSYQPQEKQLLSSRAPGHRFTGSTSIAIRQVDEEGPRVTDRASSILLKVFIFRV